MPKSTTPAKEIQDAGLQVLREKIKAVKKSATLPPLVAMHRYIEAMLYSANKEYVNHVLQGTGLLQVLLPTVRSYLAIDIALAELSLNKSLHGLHSFVNTNDFQNRYNNENLPRSDRELRELVLHSTTGKNQITGLNFFKKPHLVPMISAPANTTEPAESSQTGCIVS